MMTIKMRTTITNAKLVTFTEEICNGKLQFLYNVEPVITRKSLNVFCKKVFLEISQNSQENTCVRVSFLIKLQAQGQQLYQKRDPGTGVSL